MFHIKSSSYFDYVALTVVASVSVRSQRHTEVMIAMLSSVL